jgi:hypothetical protein
MIVAADSVEKNFADALMFCLQNLTLKTSGKQKQFPQFNFQVYYRSFTCVHRQQNRTYMYSTQCKMHEKIRREYGQMGQHQSTLTRFFASCELCTQKKHLRIL